MGIRRPRDQIHYIEREPHENTSAAVADKVDRALQNLAADHEKIKVARTQLKSLTSRVDPVGAAYLLNIQPEEDTLSTVSFDSLSERAAFASRLAALFEDDALAETSNVVSVLSPLEKMQFLRFLSLFVAHWDRRPYQLLNNDGQMKNGNANMELVALFERLHFNFQHGIGGSPHFTRSMAQNVLSIVAKKYRVETLGAFFQYLRAQYRQPAEGIVQRYMTQVRGCYLQRTMVESLLEKRLDKVDENMEALWGRNNGINDNYQKAYDQLFVSSRLKSARTYAESIFASELALSIEHKSVLRRSIGRSSGTATAEPDENVLAFLNTIIKFQSADTGQGGIDLNVFSKPIKEISKYRYSAVDAKEKINWEKFGQFYKQCNALAKAVANARTNNRMPWGERMALLGAEADLNALYDICDGLGDTEGVRDPRITNIMNLLNGNYNFQFSDQDAVRVSLRRMMMLVNESGDHYENPSFESNALDRRLALNAPGVTQSPTYTQSPDTLSQHLATLMELQHYVFWQLPKLVNPVPTDSARLYSEVLVPLERMTQGLLPLPECPIIKQVHREIVWLLNYALDTHSTALAPIAAAIFARSQVRERPDGDAIFSDIIDKTDRLVEQLMQPAYRGSLNRLRRAALALLSDVLPLMYGERVESPTVQTALKMLNHERLVRELPRLLRQTENKVDVLANANAFKSLVETFADAESAGFPDIDKMLQHYLPLKDLPEDTAPWIKASVSQKVGQARRLMRPPEHAHAGAIWSDRVDVLREALKRVDVNALEIVAPEIQAAQGVNNRYLYLDDDISALIQIAIDKSRAVTGTQAADDLAQRRAQALTLSPSAVGAQETLKDYVQYWLSDVVGSEEPRVHILPYNPENADGSSSFHWTAIILHLSADSVLSVNYMNPLHENSPIPRNLARDMSMVVSDFDRNQNTSLAKQMKFVPILHSSQDDATSCGPRIVADCAHIIEQWGNEGVVLPKLPAIKDVDALRQSHIEALGGLDSDFGQRQLWNLVFSNGREWDVAAMRAQDRLKEALLDDLVSLHMENSNNFELIRQNPKEKTWRALTKNSTIIKLINGDNMLTPDQLIKSAVEAAEKVLAMQSSLETLYDTDLEIVGDLIALQQLGEKTEQTNEQLADALRGIMASYIEGQHSMLAGANDGRRFADTNTLDRVIRGFYPNFQGVSVDPCVSDLAGEIDTLRKVLPTIDLAKSGYLKNALTVYAEAEKSDPVGTFELIQGLKQAADTSVNEAAGMTDTPNVNRCWQLIRRQIDVQGDSALLRALYPEALREAHKATQPIPKIYDDVLRKTLSEIDLSASAAVDEITKTLKTLRQRDITLYNEILSVAEIETVSERVRDRYLELRGTLAEQETTVMALQGTEAQEVAVEQGGVVNGEQGNMLAIAESQRDGSAAIKASLLPLLEKVFVNFDDALSDDDIRALQPVPSELLNMAASQARTSSATATTFSYWNPVRSLGGFLGRYTTGL